MIILSGSNHLDVRLREAMAEILRLTRTIDRMESRQAALEQSLREQRAS